MKLKAILIAMIFVSAITTKAQDVNWQARVGGGVTCLMGGVSNIDDRAGFHVGGGADIGLSKNGVFRLQPELRFERNGWQFDGYYGSEQIMKAHFSTRLDYLKLPVTVAVRLRLANQCFITFKTGAYVAYGLQAKTRMHILNTDYEETFSENHFSGSCDFHGAAYDKDNRRTGYPKFNHWDVGCIGGVDLTFHHFIIGAEVSYGLKRVCESGFIGNPLGNIATLLLTGGGPKNISAGISLAYQF